MTVKRYDMRQIFDGRMVILEVRDGAFVSHDDYAALLAERENLNQQVVIPIDRVLSIGSHLTHKSG